MSRLDEAELAFLRTGGQALARIATVDAAGMPHVVPGGWARDETRQQLLLTGRDVLATARARHVRDTGVAAVTIDGVDTSHGWTPWALLLRGAATVDDEGRLIRLRPDWSRSWGLGRR